MISKIFTLEFFSVRRRALLLTLVIAIALALPVKWVVAGVVNTIPKYGFLGGVTAYAQVRSFHGPESSNGHCEISSYTSPSTTINKIGWTWWQCDRLVNGNYYDHIHKGPRAITASGTGESIHWSYAFTPPVNGLKAHGVHDFNHTGSNPSPWRPYNVNVYP
jgi:hypothetical protein